MSDGQEGIAEFRPADRRDEGLGHSLLCDGCLMLFVIARLYSRFSRAR
jgi:hypothetical protein